MRRILTICCVLVVATVSIVSCNSDDDAVHYYTTESSGPTPELDGYNQLTVISPNSIKISDSEIFAMSWDADEKFSVYEVDGDWVADLKINDAETTVSIFTVVGDTRLDDETRYVAVYPQRESELLASYDEYFAAVQSMCSEQTQVGDSYDHLKSYNYMEVSFRGDDPITFENKRVVASIKFSVDEGDNPATLKLDNNGAESYKLNFEEVAGKSEPAAKVSKTAYLMINPFVAKVEERTLSFVVSDLEQKELLNEEIKTTVGASDGVLCSIDIDEGSISVGVDDDDTDEGDDSSSTEDLTQNEGAWN